MDNANSPRITAVISTYNRSQSVFKTLQAILSNDYPHFEVIVVDQSDDGLTEASLQTFLADSRFRYVEMPIRGLSAGLNLGIRSTKDELLAITDDDCETPANWLRELVAALTAEGRIGIVFGNTLPGPHDRLSGFVPSYVRREPFLARSMSEKHRVDGISACMGIRRSVWQALGGFDEMLGPGAPFKAGEEFDFTIRALLAGYFVYETPNVVVIHHGFRTWEQGQTLIQGYLYGIGTMFVKHFKCKHWSVIQYFLRLVWRWGFEHPVVEFGHRPSRWLRLKAFIRGFAAGAITPVLRATGHYVNRRDYRERPK